MGLKYDDTHSDQEFSENDTITPHIKAFIWDINLNDVVFIWSKSYEP